MRELIKCKTCRLGGYSHCIHPEAHPKSRQSKLKPSLNTVQMQSKRGKLRKSRSNKPSKLGKTPFSDKLKNYSNHSKIVKSKVICSVRGRGINEPYLSRIRSEVGLQKKSNLECSANIKGRIKFQKIISWELWRFIKKAETARKYEYQFVTFCDDCFVTLDRSPEVDILALKEKVRQAFRQRPEYDYIAFVDINLATNFPQGGKGASLMFHMHAIAWRVIENEVKSKPMFTENCLPGFKSIITERPVLAKVVHDHSTLKTVMAYVSKSPYWGKTITTSIKPKTRQSRINMEDFPLPKTMRFLALARILSPYSIDELIISKGSGKQIVKSSLERLRNLNPKPPRRRLSSDLRLKKRYSIERAWQAAQTGRVKVKYHTPKIRVSQLDPKILNASSKQVEDWIPIAVEKWLARRKSNQL